MINTAGDYPALLEVAQRIKTRAQESGKFAFLDIDLAFDKPEVVVDIDRAKAAQMGVSMDALGGTLATLLGEAEINRFTLEGRSYKVIAQVERLYRDNPGWLNNYYVKNEQGQLLPLSTLITLTDRARPRQLNQFQQLNSAIIQGVPMVSLGEALKTVQDIAREEAPEALPSTTPAWPASTFKKAARCGLPSAWHWRSSSWCWQHSLKVSATRW